MKVYIHPPGESWICDRFTEEFRKYCPDISTNNPNEADVIWLIADWCWNQLPYNLLKQKKVVTTNFHIVPEKFNRNAYNDFMRRDEITDLYHASCNRTADYIHNIGTEKEVWSQLVWVNGNLWKEVEKKEARSRLGLLDEDFVIGSFQRDTEGHDLKSPKLEKGPDIFCDYIEELSKHQSVVVLLGGWRRQYIINRLEKAGIQYLYHELPDFEKINLMYNSLDLYVVGSRYEGGPQSILECAITKTPIISTNVGVASEILAPESVATEVSASSLLEKTPDINYAYEKVQDLLIPQGFKPFRKKLEELCQQH